MTDDVRTGQRLAALEREWAAFKSGVEQAQRDAQRQAAFRYRAQLLDELGQLIRPPSPSPVPQPYLIATEGTAQLGYVDFNAELMSRPLRWFG